MSKKPITKKSLGDTSGSQTDWERVRNMTDEEVHEAALSDPDAQPLGKEFFDRAQVIRTPEERKAMHRKRKEARFEMRMESELKDWADEHAHSLGITSAGLVRMLLLKEKKRVESV